MSQITIDQALRLAAAHHQAHRYDAAEPIYRQIIGSEPNHFDAIQLLGLLLHQSGRDAEAIVLLRRALAMQPSSWAVRNNLALALLSAGEIDAAHHEANEVLAVNPSAGDALLVRAAALVEMGRLDESISSWQQLLQLEPQRAAAWANLGHTLERLGRFDEALPACERAVKIDPADANARLNLGWVLARMGRNDEAAAELRKALQLNPNLADAAANLSVVALNMHDADEAEASAKRAMAIDPEHAAAHANLAAALKDKGLLEDAESAMNRAAELRARCGAPRDQEIAAHLRLAAALLLPVVYESTQEIAQWRHRLIERIDALRHANVVSSVEHEPAPTAFELVYHGQDDREIHEAIASMIWSPQFNPSSRGGEKIRVGFISSYLREHTIGRLNAGVVAQLSRNEFEVTVLKIGESHDPLTTFLEHHADNYLVLPPVLPRAREMILQQHLDVLVYTDLGMEPLTYSLAFSRLAPVQCVTWGHPVTTGIKTIDYFISAVAMELPGSQSQYTERLVCLDTPAAYYFKPALPAQPKAREHFDLPTDAALYGCLQMMWKIHPEFDEILAGILRRDPRGLLLLLEGTSEFWTEKLLARLKRTMPDVADRVRIIRSQKYEDFLTLTSLCDVMLDPIHFGGGNTSYEAFAFGVPVITWQSQMLRGRITHALYKLMGVDDCTAATHQQYVDLAVGIGADPNRRRDVSEKILAAHSKLFENIDGVRDLEKFLKSAVAERARS